jgi:peptidoglycan/xylan/chitin deacetylase (PgdA/CDA1 family)
MKKQVIVTTSWDDGHKLDLTLAKLLKKYEIKGTFYISPENREFKKSDLLSNEEIVALSTDFEIGAHTMTHPRLTKICEREAYSEIFQSKRYLENLTKNKVRCFCYPAGKYNQEIKRIVKNVGFRYARTTERFCFRISDDLLLSGVALETYRNSIPNFPLDFFRILMFSKLDPIETFNNLHWEYLAKKTFDHVIKNGGIYHLWGHSWVIERNNDWNKVEHVLSYIGRRKNIKYLTNYETVDITK